MRCGAMRSIIIADDETGCKTNGRDGVADRSGRLKMRVASERRQPLVLGAAVVRRKDNVVSIR